ELLLDSVDLIHRWIRAPGLLQFRVVFTVRAIAGFQVALPQLGIAESNVFHGGDAGVEIAVAETVGLRAHHNAPDPGIDFGESNRREGRRKWRGCDEFGKVAAGEFHFTIIAEGSPGVEESGSRRDETVLLSA